MNTPEQPKHDGNITEYINVNVDIKLKSIQFNWFRDRIWFTPQEALSLLTWLQQEKPTLEQWAKEQQA